MAPVRLELHELHHTRTKSVRSGCHPSMPVVVHIQRLRSVHILASENFAAVHCGIHSVLGWICFVFGGGASAGAYSDIANEPLDSPTSHRKKERRLFVRKSTRTNLAEKQLYKYWTLLETIKGGKFGRLSASTATTKLPGSRIGKQIDAAEKQHLVRGHWQKAV